MEKAIIVKMGYVIEEFLKANHLKDAKPKDLMPILVQKGYFNKDHRDGLPLRNVLRELDEQNMLYLLPQVSVERKASNRFWYFNALKA
jgi:hypothetical protein